MTTTKAAYLEHYLDSKQLNINIINQLNCVINVYFFSFVYLALVYFLCQVYPVIELQKRYFTLSDV